MRLISVFLVVLISAPSFGVGESIYTIYLVRHAEKVIGTSPDPTLTECGNRRAENLAEIFGSVDLAEIYSSDYQRTLNTAKPTADAQQKNITFYNPRNLLKIAERLKEKKRDALVVGHSDTTAVLAGLLVGEVFEEFDESIYDRLYQVVLSGSGGRIHILHQAFVCDAANSD